MLHYEAAQVVTRTVSHSEIEGQIDASTGAEVYIKRPHDWRVVETSDGDITSATKNVIQSGRAPATVQDCLTVPVEWSRLSQATTLHQLDEILRPAAARLAVKVETKLVEFMHRNLGMSYGTPGTAVDAWSDVAGAGAHLDNLGVPQGDRYYVMNPSTETNLADKQIALASGSDKLVDEAWEQSIVRPNFAGFRAMKSNILPTRRSMNSTDRVGAINGAPTATYEAHKDTMIQSITVDGFTGAPTIKAGDIVEVTGKFYLSHATRDVFLGADGNPVKFRGVVTEDVTLSGGAGTLKVAGPAINETNGQYNTVDVALADNDVITVLGSDDGLYQPNMFYHKQAVGMCSLPLPKLEGWQSNVISKDGHTIRVTKYSGGDSAKNMVRFDIQPIFGIFNPFYGGQGFGVA